MSTSSLTTCFILFLVLSEKQGTSERPSFKRWKSTLSVEIALKAVLLRCRYFFAGIAATFAPLAGECAFIDPTVFGGRCCVTHA